METKYCEVSHNRYCVPKIDRYATCKSVTEKRLCDHYIFCEWDGEGCDWKMIVGDSCDDRNLNQCQKFPGCVWEAGVGCLGSKKNAFQEMGASLISTILFYQQPLLAIALSYWTAMASYHTADLRHTLARVRHANYPNPPFNLVLCLQQQKVIGPSIPNELIEMIVKGLPNCPPPAFNHYLKNEIVHNMKVEKTIFGLYNFIIYIFPTLHEFFSEQFNAWSAPENADLPAES